MEVGFNNFTIETNCMFDRILHDIYSLLSSCCNVFFSLVRRSGNEVAHLLAKRSLESDELLVWLEAAPEVVMPRVALDISS